MGERIEDREDERSKRLRLFEDVKMTIEARELYVLSSSLNTIFELPWENLPEEEWATVHHNIRNGLVEIQSLSSMHITNSKQEHDVDLKLYQDSLKLAKDLYAATVFLEESIGESSSDVDTIKKAKTQTLAAVDVAAKMLSSALENSH